MNRKHYSLPMYLSTALFFKYYLNLYTGGAISSKAAAPLAGMGNCTSQRGAMNGTLIGVRFL